MLRILVSARFWIIVATPVVPLVLTAWWIRPDPAPVIDARVEKRAPRITVFDGAEESLAISADSPEGEIVQDAPEEPPVSHEPADSEAAADTALTGATAREYAEAAPGAQRGPDLDAIRRRALEQFKRSHRSQRPVARQSER